MYTHILSSAYGACSDLPVGKRSALTAHVWVGAKGWLDSLTIHRDSTHVTPSGYD